TVVLPLGKTHYDERDLCQCDGDGVHVTSAIGMQMEQAEERSLDRGITTQYDVSATSPIILMVEDNVDIRAFIVNHLRAYYTVLEASDGGEGWELVQSRLPDLVITDIMMPIADGISLLKNIKQCVDTNHIPVLLLSARSAMDSVIEGLQLGSDDYMTKPF